MWLLSTALIEAPYVRYQLCTNHGLTLILIAAAGETSMVISAYILEENHTLGILDEFWGMGGWRGCLHEKDWGRELSEGRTINREARQCGC